MAPEVHTPIPNPVTRLRLKARGDFADVVKPADLKMGWAHCGQLRNGPSNTFMFLSQNL